MNDLCRFLKKCGGRNEVFSPQMVAKDHFRTPYERYMCKMARKVCCQYKKGKLGKGSGGCQYKKDKLGKESDGCQYKKDKLGKARGGCQYKKGKLGKASASFSFKQESDDFFDNKVDHRNVDIKGCRKRELDVLLGRKQTEETLGPKVTTDLRFKVTFSKKTSANFLTDEFDLFRGFFWFYGTITTGPTVFAMAFTFHDTVNSEARTAKNQNA